jgi:hypothetical protein
MPVQPSLPLSFSLPPPFFFFFFSPLHVKVRQFVEHLRALGYSRPVSHDSFRHANFALMADILKAR